MVYLESELQELKYKVLDMAELVQIQMNTCFRAIRTTDKTLAQQIIITEKKIDKFDRKIDKRCEKILALYQPLVSDLRYVFSIIKINQEIEQIGDALKYISHFILKTEIPFPEELLKHLQLEEILIKTYMMYSSVIQSFNDKDVLKSEQIIYIDDEIDALKWNVHSLIIELIRKNPEQTETYLNLLFIINRVEKIADYTVNIASEIIFLVEGRVDKPGKNKDSISFLNDQKFE